MDGGTGTGVTNGMFLAGFLAFTGEVLPLSGERLHTPGGGMFLGEENFCLAFLPLKGITSDRKKIMGAGIVALMLRRRTEKNT